MSIFVTLQLFLSHFEYIFLIRLHEQKTNDIIVAVFTEKWRKNEYIQENLLQSLAVSAQTCYTTFAVQRARAA